MTCTQSAVHLTNTVTLSVQAVEVRPADFIEVGHEVRRIARVALEHGWAWPVAFDDSGWGMALGNQVVTIWRSREAARSDDLAVA
jgi:hypothetical protein